MLKVTTAVRNDPLPIILGELADDIEEYIVTRYDSRRPPILTSRILALICQLSWTNTPWPRRLDVGEHVGCSPFTIDDTINVALVRNMISVEHMIAPSPTPNQRVERIVRKMFYRPGPALQRLSSPYRPILRARRA